MTDYFLPCGNYVFRFDHQDQKIDLAHALSEFIALHQELELVTTTTYPDMSSIRITEFDTTMLPNFYTVIICRKRGFGNKYKSITSRDSRTLESLFFYLK